MSHRARVLEHTVAARPFLCPELELRLVTHECPLWYLREEDVHAMGWETPFWAFAWPGGQALARYVLDHPHLVSGRRVLDFGGGGAVEGIAAALAGASRVRVTDLDPVALAAASLNAARAGVTLETSGDDVVGDPLEGWDVVLAGDMFYDAELSARALDWLGGVAARGALVLLGDPNRGNVPDALVEALASYDAPFDTDPRGLHLRATRVARVLPRALPGVAPTT